MNKSFLKAVYFLLFFLICILAHYLLMKFAFHSEADFTSIYIFTVAVCAATLLLLAEINEFFHGYLAFIFIGVITLKLIAAGIFMNRFELIDEIEYKYSFMVLYLISLVLITIYAAKLLLNPEK